MVSRQAPSGPRFLHIMTVSPVKSVGASVSLPHSSAFAMLFVAVIWSGEVRIAKETAALVSVRDERAAKKSFWLPILDSSSLL